MKEYTVSVATLTSPIPDELQEPQDRVTLKATPLEGNKGDTCGCFARIEGFGDLGAGEETLPIFSAELNLIYFLFEFAEAAQFNVFEGVSRALFGAERNEAGLDYIRENKGTPSSQIALDFVAAEVSVFGRVSTGAGNRAIAKAWAPILENPDAYRDLHDVNNRVPGELRDPLVVEGAIELALEVLGDRWGEVCPTCKNKLACPLYRLTYLISWAKDRESISIQDVYKALANIQ